MESKSRPAPTNFDGMHYPKQPSQNTGLNDEAQRQVDMIQRERAKGKLNPIDPNDDPQMLDRLNAAGVLRRNQTLMEWYAFYGCSKPDAIRMTNSELSSFCLQIEKNRAEEPFGEFSINHNVPVPTHILV
jgi:hypothetical protein